MLRIPVVVLKDRIKEQHKIKEQNKIKDSPTLPIATDLFIT